MNNDLDTERASVPRPGPCPAGLAGRLAAGPPPPPDRRRWTAFALLVATYFITIVDFTIVNVALPTIGRALRFPESDLQWLVTAYGLTFAGGLATSDALLIVMRGRQGLGAVGLGHR